ncbi:MAG TPA: hypothetical protein VF174_01170 [Micromonosporaceae bacterium]
MSSGPRIRIDRKAAEQLLSRDPAAWHTSGRLAGLLAAATAPAHEDELAGESAAVAAFRAAAHLGPVASAGRPSMLKLALAKLLTLKAAGAVAATTVVGGVALAAGTGNLPDGLPFSEQTPAVERSQQPDKGRPSDRPDATPSPSLVGLCRAYAAGANKEAVLANPAFSVLVDAAGGAENVDDYCATLPEPADGKGNRPSAVPTDRPGPDNHPTGAPGERPTGAPDARPTVVPGAPGDGERNGSPAATPSHPGR